MPLKTVSIICPIYNESLTVPIFFHRLSSSIKDLDSDFHFEIIFVNNCSTDNSIDVVLDIRKFDPRVKLFTLTRNFGYQRSLLAGLSRSTGDAVVFIDADCEDPPELIPRFISYWTQGYDVVYGKRGLRPEPKFLQACRKLFYRILKFIGDSPINLDMAEFSLFSSAVKESILSNNSTHPFIRNEISYYGGKQKAVEYDRQPRVAGKSYYNILGMTKFATAGLFTASTFPLRVAAYIIPVLLLVNLFLSIEYLLVKNLSFLLVLFVLDLVYLSILFSFISLYVARIYHDIVGRPKYIFDLNNSYF